MEDRVLAIKQRLAILAVQMLREVQDDEQIDAGEPVNHIIKRSLSQQLHLEERDASLVECAKKIVIRRQMRREFFPVDQVSEIGWMILLDMFIQEWKGVRTNVKACCLASGAPEATALRQISVLEAEGYIVRQGSEVDRRVSYLKMTQKAKLSMKKYLAWSLDNGHIINK